MSLPNARPYRKRFDEIARLFKRMDVEVDALNLAKDLLIELERLDVHGWQIVPVDMTEEMVEAAYRYKNTHKKWAAALSAAPELPRPT